jgi:hypothetical protein
MQPTSADILRAVVANLEELVLPQLEGDHARSAGECARMLVNHVILRLEAEGEVLAVDNAEKRTVLLGLARDLSAERVTPDIADLAAAIERGVAACPDVGEYRSVAALTAENDALKALMDVAVRRLHDARSELDESRAAALRAALRVQLRAQIDREASLVAPAMDRAPF